ncbi:MAG: flagellar hook-basal body complex protein FliE [Verrucomicrobiaceae bacterium]|nr:MAG: flagellar hook-basal body complex protein FliE [Verrucomicrobiaceae bacterium]
MTALPVQAVTNVNPTGPTAVGEAIFQPRSTSFSAMLSDGISNVEGKVAEAERMAKAFVLNDSIPVHQVTFALEQARLSLELMLQVRSRLVDGYQQLMNMQL